MIDKVSEELGKDKKAFFCESTNPIDRSLAVGRVSNEVY